MGSIPFSFGSTNIITYINIYTCMYLHVLYMYLHVAFPVLWWLLAMFSETKAIHATSTFASCFWRFWMAVRTIVELFFEFYHWRVLPLKQDSSDVVLHLLMFTEIINNGCSNFSVLLPRSLPPGARLGTRISNCNCAGKEGTAQRGSLWQDQCPPYWP